MLSSGACRPFKEFMSDTVTVLKHTSLLTKRWYLDTHGKPKQDEYGFAKTFAAKVVAVENFAELCELLGLLAADPHCCIIRGAPIAGRDLSAIQRRKNARGDEPACFREQPHCWVMLDVDLHDKEFTADYRTTEGCDAAVNTVLGKLPMECRTAGVWWQLSSSAGFKPGARCHLWFWLDRPVGEPELTRWAELANEQAGRVIVDPSVFRTVQPNYTANPVFENVVDPVVTRTGVIAGPPVALPRLTARAGLWRQKLTPLSNPANDRVHDVVRDTCAAYFCSVGPDAPEGVLATALRTAIDASCAMRGVAETKYTNEKLAEYISSGREFARTRAAEGENLLLDNSGAPKGSVGNAYAILLSSPIWKDLVAYNRRENQIELLREPPWGGTARPWTDSDSVELSKWFCIEHRMAIDDGPAFRAVNALAHLASFDPVADWLNSLTWDGVPRLDGWLTRWCGAEATSYNTKVSRLWPISAVARALLEDPTGVQVDTVLVLQGSTGVKKTSLFRVLAGKYYAAVIDEKDMVQKVHGPWITEFPELGPFKVTDVNKIKGFVDQKTDRYREPYARLPETKARRCVIVATTNETQWQEDATSARRFWPVNVGMIDLDLARAERDQLWAEAVAAYRAGETWWVDAGDPDFCTAQEQQYARDPWQEAITWILEHGGSNYAHGNNVVISGGAERVTTYQVFVACFGDLKQTKRDQVRIAKCMRKLGWTADGEGGFCKNRA